MAVELGRRLGREPGIRGAPAAEAPPVDAVVLGCHGGAGATTLAELLRTPWDLGRYESGTRRIETFGRPLVLVARDSAPASARAVEAVTGVAESGAAIACLVVVADGSGPEPREAAARIRLIEDRVGEIVRLPFAAGIRYADAADVGKVDLPKKVERALSRIRSACGTGGSGDYGHE
ncbi:hypothetical protein [Streptomonospora arabica]|uniref:Uncharacterized protein n=1 Tax=Streptomonospora arabica TaxID=412417 RepID=A0ABV9SIJ4_9ACTN